MHEERGNSEVLSVVEVAAILRVHKNTVRALINRGELPAFRTNPNTNNAPWRVTRAELERFIRRATFDPQAVAS